MPRAIIPPPGLYGQSLSSPPLFGITLYLMFGRTGLTKRTKAHYEKVAGNSALSLSRKGNPPKPQGENIYIHNQQSYIQHSSGFPVYQKYGHNLLSADRACPGSHAEGSGKRPGIYFMEYFAVEDTEVFHRIEEVLMKKVSEGVEVRFIYDDFGSIGFVKPEFMRRLNRQGIQCRIFNPLIPLLYVFMNHRTIAK